MEFFGDTRESWVWMRNSRFVHTPNAAAVPGRVSKRYNRCNMNAATQQALLGIVAGYAAKVNKKKRKSVWHNAWVHWADSAAHIFSCVRRNSNWRHGHSWVRETRTASFQLAESRRLLGLTRVLEFFNSDSGLMTREFHQKTPRLYGPLGIHWFCIQLLEKSICCKIVVAIAVDFTKPHPLTRFS